MIPQTGNSDIGTLSSAAAGSNSQIMRLGARTQAFVTMETAHSYVSGSLTSQVPTEAEVKEFVFYILYFALSFW